MKKYTRSVIRVVFLGLVFLILLDFFGVMPKSLKSVMNPSPTVTLLPLIRHTISEVVDVKPIWSIDDSYVLWDRFGTTLDAAAGKACYLGNLKKNRTYNYFICIDSLNGAVLWDYESGVNSNLMVTPRGIFVTNSSPARIRKYDPQNGDLIWNKNLSGTGSLYLSGLNDQIQVLTIPDVLWIFDTDGNEIKKITGKRIFVSTSAETFVKLNGLQAYKTGTDDLLWEHVDFSLIRMPVFTQEKIFLRNGDLRGNAYALDRNTGKLLWTTADIVSGVAYSPEKQVIYTLRENGDLLAIDENSGKESVIVRFTSVPFSSGGTDSYGYQVAYDVDNHILVVSLGDSRQLFGFQEKR